MSERLRLLCFAFVHMNIHCYTLATTTQHNTIAILLTIPKLANHHTISTNLNQFNLLLSTLLLGRNNPEVTVGRIFLGSLGLRRALLGNLAPATRSRISGTTALGWGGSVNKALVREPLAANELLSEVAGVDGRAAAVDGFGDELGFRGEEDEVGDELLSCEWLWLACVFSLM